MFRRTKRASEDGPGRSAVWQVWDTLGYVRIGPALELTVQASFLKLQVAIFERLLPQESRFSNFNSQVLLDASHESCVFTTSTCVQFFEGCLARKLFTALACRFCRKMQEVSHQSFVFSTSVFSFGGLLFRDRTWQWWSAPRENLEPRFSNLGQLLTASAEAAVQDPFARFCKAICTRCLQEISTQDVCKCL
jgi:hypothetical protein